MFIPNVFFEPEDIKVMVKNGIFLGEFYYRKSDVKYYKINDRKLRELIDLVYDNSILGDHDKSDIEFRLKAFTKVFTNIVEAKSDEQRGKLLGQVLLMYPVNNQDAKFLMSLI